MGSDIGYLISGDYTPISYDEKKMNNEVWENRENISHKNFSIS